MTDLRLVLKSLMARSASTAVTCLLIAIAVALLLSMLSLREAGRRSFTRGVGNAHLVVSGDSSPLVAVLNGLFYANAPRAALPESKVVEITTSFPWAWAIPTQLGDSFRGFPVIATTPQFLEDFEPAPGEPWVFAEGRNIELPFEVVLASGVAAATGLGIGDRLHLTHGMGVGGAPPVSAPSVENSMIASVPGPPVDESLEAEADAHDHSHDHAHGHVHADDGEHVHDEVVFEVVGVLEPSGTHHDRLVVTELQGAWFIHAIDRREVAGRALPVSVEDLEAGDRLITGILLRTPVRAGRNSAAVLQGAFDRLRRDPSITVASPSTQVDRLFGIVASLDAVFIALGGGILLSGVISVMLVLWNSMELRRRQIAVLRVIGCPQRRILGLVLTESAIIGLVGAIVGGLLAVGGASLAAGLLAMRTGVVIAPTVDPQASVLIAAGTVALAALAGVAPAIKAYRTPVADNLRPLD
ncbi:MAG: ABC transporter permease [Phycisphaerales bacterium]|jgi:putative ABC transport system permease protein|nr:ABC transporter permease [Phycisphaerales bacterium]